MKILVLSCDKNTELFEPFRHCLEKYWPNHPEVYYLMNTIRNPFYKTICIDYPLEEWTKEVRECLEQIPDNQILIMIDDCFIRRPVDEERIKYASEILTGNIALINFEKSWCDSDTECGLIGFKKRKNGADYVVSIMCGLWQKDKLMKVLEPVSNPWNVEYNQNHCNYEYLINSGDYIIDWGYRTFTECNIVKGKWTHSCKDFLDSEGLSVNYKIKGFL